jgi:RND family efflux transporter MFP subunit
MRKIITILIFLELLFISCGKDKKDQALNNESAISVQVSKISPNNNQLFVTASGKIEAKNSANLSTRMMGFITKVNVKVGQKVRAGQLLISINNSDLLAKRAQVEASVLQAAAAYNNAEKDYNRFVTLFAQQSATQKELDDMTAHYEITKASLEGAKQLKNGVISQFSYSNITAPFSGEVTNTFVKKGDMAKPGMSLVSLEDNSRLQVTAMVAESDITSIKNGMKVKVIVKSTNKELMGKVSEVSLSAKNTGAQYLVKIDLQKADNNVLPGMIVNIRFLFTNYNTSTTKGSPIVLVSERALVKKGQLTGIYTIGNGNIAILRWLRIGKIFGNQVQVLSGLSYDEQYIVSADGKLYNGAKVSIN